MRIITISFLTLAGLVIGYFTVNAQSLSPPHLDDQCDTCHIAGNNVTPENAKQLFSNQDQLCAKCHKETEVASHPSEVPGNAAINDEFPLDWKGDVTCSTCHNIHFETADTSIRSSKRGKAFCMSCHDQAFFEKISDGGTSIVDKGHLGAISNNARGLDPFSIQCIKCHQSEATAPGIVVDENNIVRHLSGNANHPIGVSYEDAFNYGGYHPMSEVPKIMFLFEGKLSCLTCHLGYKQEHGKVIRPSKGMCSSCHDL